MQLVNPICISMCTVVKKKNMNKMRMRRKQQQITEIHRTYEDSATNRIRFSGHIYVVDVMCLSFLVCSG